MSKKDIIKLADALAERRHAKVGQLRKYTNEPYIVHPRAVAKTVRAYDGSKDMIAAALLHDVLEDTLTEEDTFEAVEAEILEATNPNVLRMVIGLTDVAKPEDGNRSARVRINIDHIARQGGDVKTIKLADIQNNVQNIAHYDPKFAITYLEEKKLAMPFLRGGAQPLYWEVYDLIERLQRKLDK